MSYIPGRPAGDRSLWLITGSPLLWAAHFFLCYVTAAVWCAKVVGPGGSLGGARGAIAVYTALALPGIALIGWIAFRRHRLGAADLPHDADTPEDRHRFLGFAALLLSGLSAVAVIYAALAAVFFERCH
jgi:hypothetical protein